MGDSFNLDEVPAACDGCGRDAQAAGMHRTGWTVRRPQASFAGVYCFSCASTLRLLGNVIECTECGRAVSEERAEWAGWRFYADAAEELHAYCPDCAQREFQPVP